MVKCAIVLRVTVILHTFFGLCPPMYGILRYVYFKIFYI